jgi:catechol 2,3-dioxygenase-like lactoylglutathione lyase family enzyme
VPIRGLAEIVILVDDLARMRDFYENVLGFRRMDEETDVLRGTSPESFANTDEPYAFYRIRDEGGLHGDLFALFDAKARGRQPGEQAASRLEHIAFRIDLADFAAEKARLESLGVEVREKEFPFIRCRSLFFQDPEQNTIELVADDPSVVG